jgi:hypothetical protein
VRVLDAIVTSDWSLCTQHTTDLLNDAFSLLQHCTIPKSQNPEPTRFQLSRSHIIVALSPVCVMLAVDLNDQPCSDAAKVDDVWVDNYLSAEFPAFEISVSQKRPHAFLGISWTAAESAGAG